jgi:2-hydroxy-6-oxonona-2,4-dienedioate hydrolase
VVTDERWGTQLSIPIGRNRLAVRTAGDGPPVVLVHGLGASSRYWSANAPALVAAGFRVLAPDLPGFGGSRRAVAAVTPRDQAGALSSWAASSGIPAAGWIGHSLGCQTLLELATARPDLAQAISGRSSSWGPVICRPVPPLERVGRSTTLTRGR